MSTGAQLASEGGSGQGRQRERRGRSPLPFFKNIQKVSWLGKKCILILQKCSVFVSIYGLNSHLRCSFKNNFKKKPQHFSLRGFLLCAAHETYIKMSLFRETFLAPENFRSLHLKLRRYFLMFHNLHCEKYSYFI